MECIHEYKAVDEDELSFGMGDVITVVNWDSTDEQVGIISVEKYNSMWIKLTHKFLTSKQINQRSINIKVGT